MQNHEAFELLTARLKSFAAVNDEMAALFEEHGKVIHVPKKNLLVAAGAVDDSAYFIARGAFMMSVVTDEGVTRATTFFLDHYNDFMRCPDSSYLHLPTIYQLMAVEDSVVIKYNNRFMSDLLDNNHDLLRYWYYELQRANAASNKIRDARLALPAAKFLQMLYNDYPLLFQRFPSQHIAEFIGITPVWLSNLKKRLFS
jgi:CRP-like cAMP-binding protein